MHILKYSLVDSTNNKARELLDAGIVDNTVVWALEQSAGRGQYGRDFFSPAGGLYFSLLIKPDIPLHLLPCVTLVVGLALVCCLERKYSVVNPRLKWPNDVYIDNKKLAGILVESTPLLDNRELALIIGVGVNVEIQKIDTPRPIICLQEVVPDKVELETLLIRISENILANLACFEKKWPLFLRQWQLYDYLFDRNISCLLNGDKVSGIGRGVDEDGRYRLLDSAGILHHISSGSLSLG